MRGLSPVEWGMQKEMQNIAELGNPNHEKGTYSKTKQKTLLDYASSQT